MIEQVLNVLKNYFSSPIGAIAITFAFFFCIYFVFASVAHFIEKLANNPIYPKKNTNQIWQEITNSLMSIAIFSLGILVIWGGIEYKVFKVTWESGYIVLLEITALIIWNDLHFYGAHRLLHSFTAFKKIHGLHHKSRPSTAFSAYSFHPVEAIILGSVLPMAMLIHDFSIRSLLLLPLWSIVINVISHTNIKHLWLSEHHQAHHYYYNGNYGFFFNLFDYIFSTECKKILRLKFGCHSPTIKNLKQSF